MKKATLLILVIFMIGLTANAKGKYKGKKGKSSDTKGYYAFSVGPSIPLGDYASTTLSPTQIPGAAKTGLHINVANFGYKFAGSFGVCGIVSVGTNSFNAEKVTTIKDKDSYWVNGVVMLGPLASFDVGDQISLDLRPMGGLVYTSSPEANDNGSGTLIKSDRKSTFGLGFGTSCRFHMSSKVDLGLNLDYLTANQKFTPELMGVKDEWTQQISLLAITVGMAFRF